MLRAQIDELNAEMVVARAEAVRALAEERQRADRLSARVEVLSAEAVRTEKQLRQTKAHLAKHSTAILTK